MTEQETVAAYLDGYVQLLADASATGRRLTRDELDARRALGERAAEAGHGCAPWSPPI